MFFITRLSMTMKFNVEYNDLYNKCRTKNFECLSLQFALIWEGSGPVVVYVKCSVENPTIYILYIV